MQIFFRKNAFGGENPVFVKILGRCGVSPLEGVAEDTAGSWFEIASPLIGVRNDNRAGAVARGRLPPAAFMPPIPVFSTPIHAFLGRIPVFLRPIPAF